MGKINTVMINKNAVEGFRTKSINNLADSAASIY
jgi:hypothetical protein